MDIKINFAIVGADRIAVNGDVANKIGTYQLAIACKYHKIPFFVAAPLSTFDFECPEGKMIEGLNSSISILRFDISVLKIP